MAVAVVANGVGRTASQGSSLTHALDVGSVGSNGLLTVKLRMQDGSTVSNVQFDGVAMTAVGAAVGASRVWQLVAPATGTKNLTFDNSGYDYCFFDWVSWSDADQSTPCGTQVGTSSSASGTRTTGSVTCPTNGAVFGSIYDSYSDSAPSVVAGTSLGTYYTGSSTAHASAYRTSTGAVSMDDSNYANAWEAIGVPINAATTAAPVITVQPTEQTAADGGTAVFSATVTGATSYQWQYRSPIGSAYASVSGGSGGTSSAWTTGTLARSDAGTLVRLKASNAGGDTYSNEVLLRVTQIPTSYSASVGLVVGSSLSWVGFSYVGASDSSAAGSHPTTGALASDASQVSGTAAHLTLHPTSGALAAQASTIAGTADHRTLHATTGALSAQAATIAGSAEQAGHPSSGALAAQDAIIAGSAAHYTLHASSGALAADAATIAGSAVHPHTTTGALSSAAATLSGAATHLTLHATSGALAAQDSTVAGTAARQHAATGALASADATLAGTAAHLTLHTTTGALSAAAATIAGSAEHSVDGAFTTEGALASQSATVAGSAAHLALHATSGALSAAAATLSGAAAHPHTTSGALSAQAATVAGAAVHPHVSSGALAADAATVAGAAEHAAPGTHETSGALQAGAATISGTAALVSLAPAVSGADGSSRPKRRRRRLVKEDQDERPAEVVARAAPEPEQSPAETTLEKPRAIPEPVAPAEPALAAALPQPKNPAAPFAQAQLALEPMPDPEAVMAEALERARRARVERNNRAAMAAAELLLMAD